MIDYELFSHITENYKQIEDIIDARKQLGQYNVHKPTHTVNYRYAYSSSSVPTERFVRFDDTMLLYEGDSLNTSNIKRTDSEVTVVRIRCDFKRRKSKWDMHDIAVPGDGSHLGESPSMVNLATLVAQNIHCEGDEYLVPLSSWDPYYKNEDQHPELKCCSNASKIDNKCPDGNYLNTTATANDTESFEEDISLNSDLVYKISVNLERSQIMTKRPSLAGRISKFIRKHCKKSKTLPETNLNQN